MIYIDSGSNTYGDELPHRETQAWPFLLQKQLGLPVFNNAIQGKSNQHILFDLVNHCVTHKPKLVVIGWVHVSRKMFVRRENNYIIDITVSSSNSIYKNSKELKQLQGLLYKHWSNYLYDIWQFLQTILIAQTFLKSYNISYLMFNDSSKSDIIDLLTIFSQPVKIKEHLLDAFDQMNDDQILTVEKIINSIFDQIDHTNFYDFSWHLGDIVDLSGGTNHPTVADHQTIMRFLLPEICARL